MQPTTSVSWYDKPVLVNILLFLFFPVGLYALWKSNKIALWWKVGGTVLIAAIVLNSLTKPKREYRGDHASAPTEAEQRQREQASVANQQARAEAEAQEVADNTIPAQVLMEAYDQNEARADNKYKGQTIYVQGTIVDIKKDIFDKIYVALDAGAGIQQVQCFIDDEDVAANLNQGEQVVLQGRCAGLALLNVQLKDCQLVK